MKVLTRSQIKDQTSNLGAMVMIYSETGIGKSVSTLLTAPDPIAYIQTEPRSLKPIEELIQKYRPDLRYSAFKYDNADDLLKTLSEPKNFADYRTILFDGFSFLMYVSLAEEITGEAHEARTANIKPNEKIVKPLMSMTKMTVEGQGIRNQLMFRIAKLLMVLSSEHNKIVIVTALVQERPKYNRSLAAAPSLAAKEFPENMPGYFDYIGLLVPRVNKDDELVYPPYVKFASPDNSFIAKYTGVGEQKEGVYNVSKILGV